MDRKSVSEFTDPMDLVSFRDRVLVWKSPLLRHRLGNLWTTTQSADSTFGKFSWWFHFRARWWWIPQEICLRWSKKLWIQNQYWKNTCKVKGFHLNSKGHSQLNYEIMKQNILDEVTNPLDSARKIPILVSDSIQRDRKNYKLCQPDKELPDGLHKKSPFTATQWNMRNKLYYDSTLWV